MSTKSISESSNTTFPNSPSLSSLSSKRSFGIKAQNIDFKNIKKWSIDSTLKWLKSIGYEDCDKYFLEQNINGQALLMLNEDDLKEVIKHNVGQRKNLYHLIKQLQVNYNKTRSSNSFFDEDETDDTEHETDLDSDSCKEITEKSDNSALNRSSLSDDLNIGSGLGLRQREKNDMQKNLMLTRKMTTMFSRVYASIVSKCIITHRMRTNQFT